MHRETTEARQFEEAIRVHGVEMAATASVNADHPSTLQITDRGPCTALGEAQASRYLANGAPRSCDDGEEGSFVTRHQAPSVG